MKVHGTFVSSRTPEAGFAAIVNHNHQKPLEFNLGLRSGRYYGLGRRDLQTLQIPTVIADEGQRINPKISIKAVGIQVSNGPAQVNALRDGFWFGHGYVPHVMPANGSTDPAKITREIASLYDADGTPLIRYGPHRKVIPTHLVSLENHDMADPEAMAQIRHFANELSLDAGTNKIVRINSTPRGGGVAIMLHAQTRLGEEMGLPIDWHVMEPDEAAFNVTKRKIHNIFQGVAPEGTRLEQDDKDVLYKWSKRNAQLLEPVFKQAEFLVIDDSQPVGLIPYALRANPNLKIFFRFHIEAMKNLTDLPGTPQYELMQYLWDGDPRMDDPNHPENNGLKAAKAFIVHPKHTFVPSIMPRERVFAMAATTDRFDGLNKELSPLELGALQDEVNQLLVESGQKPLDYSRLIASQRSRFDPSKGQADVIRAFKLTWDQMVKEGKPPPQLVIVGNSAADDPDGKPILKELDHLLKSSEYKYMADDVKILQAPPNDLLLNAILRSSRFALQLSLREGFEFNVEEIIMKGIPVIGSNRGGIPLQIDEGAGYIVDPGGSRHFSQRAINEVAHHMYDLFNDDVLHAQMGRAAKNSAHEDFKTEQNLANWYFLALNATRQLKQFGRITNGNFATDPNDPEKGYVPAMARKLYAQETGRSSLRRNKRRRSPLPLVA